MPECKHLDVPEDVCYVRFGQKVKPHNSNEIGTTQRGEWIIADYDVNGRIIGLELVGGSKPCQEWSTQI